MELFRKAKSLGQTAIAVTDHGTLAAAADSLKASKETGVKLIMGCEFNFTDDLNDPSGRLRHIILLATSAASYRNLLHLHFEAGKNHTVLFKKVTPRIDWKLLEKYSEGLICTTACGGGILGQLINNKKIPQAKQQAKRLKDIFGDRLALELQPHNMKRVSNPYKDYEDQKFLNRQLINLSKELSIKAIVATNSHYLDPLHHEAHDVELAIGSGQPQYSNNRLRYSNDFYVRSREEIIQYFDRNFSKEEGEEFCDNSLYFAGLCEDPQWIDPKFSNPSGKELPEFPVVDQADYKEFSVWKEGNYPNLPDDAAYFRYKCEQGFIFRGIDPNDPIYRERLNEELDVFEHNSLIGYMLIVMNMLEWCKNNNIKVGPGRGCLTGNTLVLTDSGFKNLSEIAINDEVFTHTGKKQKVLECFKYDVDESLLEIESNGSFGNLIMTKDHKVFSCQSLETEEYVRRKQKGLRTDKCKKWKDNSEPTWIPAEKLKVGDIIYLTPPERKTSNIEPFDLSAFKNDKDIVTDQYIEQHVPLDNDLAIRSIAKSTGLPRHTVSRFKKNKNISPNKKLKNSQVESFKKIESIVGDVFAWKDDSNQEIFKIKRFIELDSYFSYILGRWVGDGWWTSNSNGQYNIGIAFHSEDSSIEEVNRWFISNGFKTSIFKHNSKKLNQLIVNGKIICKLFQSIFVDYHSKSSSKHLPSFFRSIPNDLLERILQGLQDSDGHVKKSKRSNGRINIDSTSYRLILEVKEALLYLGKSSSIRTRKEYMRGKYACNTSYKLRINKNQIPFKNHIGCRITNIFKAQDNSVYDIKVENDHSYLTSNGVVHNSVGGSLSAFLTGIHEANPITYQLIFARFQNKYKQSLADIDSDISPEGVEPLHHYLAEKYGVDNVAKVSNYITVSPRPYAKDIARAFEFGGDRKAAVAIGAAISSTIPEDPTDPNTKSVMKALEAFPLFAEYADSPKYNQLRKYAELLDNKPKAFGTHAAGIVIGKRPLVDIVPLRIDKESSVCLEYEKDRAEENGLVKIDTLRLENLAIIKKTHQYIKESGKQLKPVQYDQYDEATYDLLSRGDVLGVFQLGQSPGTISLCKQIKPKNIEEISMINSLARPSAASFRADFIATKEGKVPVKLLHPSLQRAFGPTFGFGLYEECLMYLAQDVAGWDLHKADALRKMTKNKGKDADKTAKLKQEFIEGAEIKGIGRRIGKKVWEEVVEKFQGYGFNKSHSVLYSFTSFETAFLKAHYPVEFLVANLVSKAGSSNPKDKSACIKIKREIRSKGIKLLPPHINESMETYSIVDDSTVRLGFDSLKYIGKDSVPEILAKRPFHSFEDFLTRTNPSSVKAPAIMALAASGALDLFGRTRRQMFLYGADFRKKLQSYEKKKKKTQPFQYPWTDEPEWIGKDIYALEEEYVGESLTVDKFEAYPGFFQRSDWKFPQYAENFPDPNNPKENWELKRPLNGVIVDYHTFKVKKGDSKGEDMMKVMLEDPYGNAMVCTIFASDLKKIKKTVKNLAGELEIGQAISCWGSLNWWEGNISLVMKNILKIMPAPVVPKDLKARQVKMTRATEELKLADSVDEDEVLEEIEEELVMDGFADLDD